MPVTSYSRTPNSNSSAPPNGAPEGMAPSAVNNTIRQIMTDIVNEAAKNQAKVLGTVAGTNTITGVLSPALDAYTAGMIVVFTPANTNSGAATLNINTLGALDILTLGGSAIAAGDLVAGVPALLVLDSGADDFLLLNPCTLLTPAAGNSLYARLASANTFTQPTRLLAADPYIRWSESGVTADNSEWTIEVNSEAMSFRLYNDAFNSGASWLAVNRTANNCDGIALTTDNLAWNGNTLLTSASTLDATKLSGTVPTASITAVATAATINSLPIGFATVPTANDFTTGKVYTLNVGDTLNTADMAEGRCFSVYNDSASSITITAGSGVTLRLAGSASFGDRTIAARGMMTIWCRSGAEAVAMGPGVA